MADGGDAFEAYLRALAARCAADPESMPKVLEFRRALRAGRPYVGAALVPVLHADGHGPEQPKGVLPMSVDIILPVHNALEDVQACLGSVLRTADNHLRHVWLVDDGSAPETAQWLAAQQDGLVRTLRTPENLGFTGAVALGFQHSTAELVVVLNSDAVVDDGWLKALIRPFQEDARVALTGPLSNAAAWQNLGRVTNSEGLFATNLMQPVAEMGEINRFLRRHGTGGFLDLPIVHGFCFAISRAAYDRVGGFDLQNFGAGYGETQDLCFRLRSAGYRIGVCTDVFVQHGRSRSYSDAQRTSLSTAARRKLYRKHGALNYLTAEADCIDHAQLTQIRAEAAGWFAQDLLEIQIDAADAPHPFTFKEIALCQHNRRQGRRFGKSLIGLPRGGKANVVSISWQTPVSSSNHAIEPHRPFELGTDWHRDKHTDSLRALHANQERPAASILMVCFHAPTIKHAGGLRILDIIREIKMRRPETYIEIFTPKNQDLYGALDTAIQLVDKVTFAEAYSFTVGDYLERSGRHDAFFDVVDFQFPQPIAVIEGYRDIGDKLIFTPMESHIHNEFLDLERSFDRKQGLQTQPAREEAEIAQAVDLTVCVSETDRNAVAKAVDAPVIAIETGLSDIEFSEDLATKITAPLTVCYVAYFGSRTNRDALRWYLDKVHPLVLEALPDYSFAIIGQGEIDGILDGRTAGINHIGEVDRIGPYIKGAAVGIAPALYGAGFRGKVNQYAICGVPTVASPIAARGLAYCDGESILVAESPEDFAAAIIRLLRDDAFRSEMAAKARNVAQATYTWASKWPAISQAYSLPAPVWAPLDRSVHAIVPSYRHSKFIEERIRSIFAQEYSNIRVTVIDDHSDDGTHEILCKLQSEFDFEYIRCDQNSGSPFTAWKFAAENTTEDYIWICESDDSADPRFLSTLFRHLTARPKAVVAYCASWVIDAAGQRIATTATYHANIFHPTRWTRPFCAEGRRELERYIRFGMVVPNMSSALIDSQAFRKALTPDILKYRLAGDWLFLGQIALQGDLVFVPELLNYFRSHPQTSRAETQIVRELAEHFSVRLSLSELAGVASLQSLDALKHDIGKLIREPELIEPVAEELHRFDPAQADALRRYVKMHDVVGGDSEDLIKALHSLAMLPTPGNTI